MEEQDTKDTLNKEWEDKKLQRIQEAELLKSKSKRKPKRKRQREARQKAKKAES